MMAAAFCGHGRSLDERRAPPGFEAGRGGFKRLLKLLVGEFLECLQDFAVVGVDALVGHGFVLEFLIVVAANAECVNSL